MVELSAAARQAEEEAEPPEWLAEEGMPTGQEADAEPMGLELHPDAPLSPEDGVPRRRGAATCAALLAGALLLCILCMVS